MNLNALKSSVTGVMAENKWSRVVIAALALLGLVAVVALIDKKPIVVLQPPLLSQKAEVEFDRATAAYMDPWALSLAVLIGNISPENVSFVVEYVGTLADPSIRNDLEESLRAQAKEMKDERITTSFRPRSMDYDKRIGRIYVTGEHTTLGPSADAIKEQRTIEVDLRIRNYLIQLTHLDAYKGAPKKDKK